MTLFLIKLSLSLSLSLSMCVCVCVSLCQLQELEKSAEDRGELLALVDAYQEMLNERDTLRDGTRHASRYIVVFKLYSL